MRRRIHEIWPKNKKVSIQIEKTHLCNMLYNLLFIENNVIIPDKGRVVILYIVDIFGNNFQANDNVIETLHKPAEKHSRLDLVPIYRVSHVTWVYC